MEQSYPLKQEWTSPDAIDNWWVDKAKTLNDEEIPCVACHSRGVDRWGDDCPECGGMGVRYRQAL